MTVRAETYMLARLHQEFADAGVRMRLVAAHAPVCGIRRAEGLKESAGGFGRRICVAVVIDDFEGRAAPPATT